MSNIAAHTTGLRGWQRAAAAILFLAGVVVILLSALMPDMDAEQTLASGGTAFFKVPESVVYLYVLILAVVPALLVMCLPIALAWRIVLAVLLFSTWDLTFAPMVPAFALGLWLAMRGYGAKLALSLAVVAIGLGYWDFTLGHWYIGAPVAIWLLIVLLLALGTGQLRRAALPWVLALCVPFVLYWAWVALPMLWEVSNISAVDTRLSAIFTAILAPGNLGYRPGAVEFCAILGAMMALSRGRPAKPGEWMAAAALMIATGLMLGIQKPVFSSVVILFALITHTLLAAWLFLRARPS